MGSAFFALTEGDIEMQLFGGFGLLFFGFGLFIFACALLRSRSRGLVQFSQEGLWLANLGVTLPWTSIGPAWVLTTKHSGGKTDDVVFIAHDLDSYTRDVDLVSRLHLRLMKRTLDVGKGGVLDFGLELLFSAADEEGSLGEVMEQMEHARDQAGSDPSAVLLNIPVPFRLGIPPRDLVAILNSELSKRSEANLGSEDVQPT